MNQDFLQSYLLAYVFWVMLSLGCFAMMLLHNVLKGRWGLPVLRVFEAGARTLPLMFVLFVPILLGMHELYSWSRPEVVAADKVLQWKQPYLNPSFFIIRFVVYFAIWISLTYLLSFWTRRQDETQDPIYEQKRANLAAPGLVLFFLTVTFAFTDWVMSLDPHWFSTIYGVWFAAGMALAGLSFGIIVLTGSRDPNVQALVTKPLKRDLGNLMVVLVMFWAYVSLSQYLIIWSANLPEEIVYYRNRMLGGWNAMGAFIVVAQFFIPFLALLSTRMKKDGGNLRAIACWLMAMRFVDVLWVVAPTFRPHVGVVLMDIVLTVAMGALWLGVYRWNLASSVRLPTYDPRMREAPDHA